MRSPDAVREQVIRSWIDSARDDLAWADMGARTEDLRGVAQIGFHAQQAVEKLLKAVLASYDVVPEEHHDLARLLAQVHLLDRRTAEALPAVGRLTPYAAQYRYPPRPGRVHSLSRSQVLEDLEMARTACAVLESALTARIASLSGGERP